MAAEGELPFPVDARWTARVVDYRSEDEFLTLDFSSAQPACYRGKAVTLVQLRAQLLRALWAALLPPVRSRAGHHRRAAAGRVAHQHPHLARARLCGSGCVHVRRCAADGRHRPHPRSAWRASSQRARVLARGAAGRPSSQRSAVRALRDAGAAVCAGCRHEVLRKTCITVAGVRPVNCKAAGGRAGLTYISAPKFPACCD